MIFNKKGHIIFGLLASIAFIQYPHQLIYVMIGSLLPDIDHPTSTFGRYNPFTCVMKHRGKCHTIIGCLILSIPFLIFGLEGFIYVLIGCFSHLLGDKIYSLSSRKHRRFAIRLW